MKSKWTVLSRKALRGLIFLVCLLTTAVAAADEAHNNTGLTEQRVRETACKTAQASIKQQILTPATAKFPDCFGDEAPDIRRTGEADAVAVQGTFDAQNAFGALVRQDYLVMLERDGGPNDAPVWKADLVIINDEPTYIAPGVDFKRTPDGGISLNHKKR